MRQLYWNVSALYLNSIAMCDNLCICFICIYQVLVALFGWLPTYQFTFGSLQVLSSGLYPRTGRAPPNVTISDLFNDKHTTDAWVYYMCSTAAAIVLIALYESIRARAMLSPISDWFSLKFMFCSTAESRQQPQAPALITDNDVRCTALLPNVSLI